ncbi:KGG domain-containing protein [Hymenobacter jeollabukensis]|uniref:General stress protein n=1 Tax=Hymenobacter jeollabukensis TaxID=2025313 RepID=A0A5R8WMA2_9BACT|nr:KGG domain-containing protein [Hymenobacter jeollabukensis]TLM90545.1 general stress protein [Hymenobacter jeollabukensis]
MATNHVTQRTTSGAAAAKAGGSRPQSNTSRRGFASMDPEQQRRIASEGGKASHASGRGHEWTSQEAREAGRKGGQSSTRRSTAKTA